MVDTVWEPGRDLIAETRGCLRVELLRVGDRPLSPATEQALSFGLPRAWPVAAAIL
ncbi:MAG: hypothetical protein AAF074_11510 [Pseudomonadota bacterium]